MKHTIVDSKIFTVTMYTSSVHAVRMNTSTFAYIVTYLRSFSGVKGTTATGLSAGRLYTNISALNVIHIKLGHPTSRKDTYLRT